MMNEELNKKITQLKTKIELLETINEVKMLYLQNKINSLRRAIYFISVATMINSLLILALYYKI